MKEKHYGNFRVYSTRNNAHIEFNVGWMGLDPEDIENLEKAIKDYKSRIKKIDEREEKLRRKTRRRRIKR